MKRLALNFLVVFVIQFSLGKDTKCESNGFTCIDSEHFQQCNRNNVNNTLINSPIACPKNHICDVVNGSVTCTLINVVPISADLEDKTCTSPSKFEAPLRYQYYECVQNWFRWELVLKTCPQGELFDLSLGTCAIPPPVTKPKCKEPGKYPALQCFQYFECVRKWWWWETKLRNCPKGQAFDPFTKTCVCAGVLKCSLPSSGISCEGPGTQLGFNCSEYYDCTKFLWWWQPVLKKCPDGQIYDTKTCQCAPEAEAECSPRKCEGYKKYPAETQNQYYECTLKESGVEWELQLKNCSLGTYYSNLKEKCVFRFF
ncbi:uncharacterized protein LOC123011483 [Tribolium madens]|uniref:uncharacterized protein LOC123011483 n=1 Tax=Tribolium madens TaxID=41895 RepID=UPI001CF736BF|nr:uncharacterized protein LOC123011483 [Tribolium madens]